MLWTSQFGSTTDERAGGAALDSMDSAYVVGSTLGSLPGQTSSGSEDAFVRKYDSNGNELWTRQFGTSTVDQGLAVAVDRASDNITVVGSTFGAFVGLPLGSGDVFVRTYDTAGNEVWIRQFGTSDFDVALGVAIHQSSGNISVAGWTTGILRGQTTLFGPDAFVRTYDAGGDEIWTRQFGTISRGSDVGVDEAGNVYVSGEGGALTAQLTPGFFVRKYDAAGTEQWTQQFAASNQQFSNPDESSGVAVDGMSNVYLVGFTSGVLPAQVSSGHFDAFIVQIVQATADSIVPDTRILSAVDGNGMAVANGGSTVSTFITFTFDGSDNVGVASFECSLDEAPFTACTSPANYSDLAPGWHGFQVRAIDEAGNVDPTPAEFTWEVLTPSEGVEYLITTVDELPLSGGLKTSLKAPLNNAYKKLTDNQPNNDMAACDSLDDFIAQVNDFLAAGKLTSDQAEPLIQAALAIKDAQGCP